MSSDVRILILAGSLLLTLAVVASLVRSVRELELEGKLRDDRLRAALKPLGEL